MKKLFALFALVGALFVPAQNNIVHADSYVIPNYSTCVAPELQALGDRICFDQTTPYGPRAWVYDTATHYTAYVNFTQEFNPSGFLAGPFINTRSARAVGWDADYNTYAIYLQPPGLWNDPYHDLSLLGFYNNSALCSDGWPVADYDHCSASAYAYWNILYTAANSYSVEVVYLL